MLRPEEPNHSKTLEKSTVDMYSRSEYIVTVVIIYMLVDNLSGILLLAAVFMRQKSLEGGLETV
eukprot:snap_masked-scaffold_6-processed-gene-7.28-mRNA-1 protein AED:1.00 eAED:1.00 QI:0/-1/0/0/-1/1/1/0/63